MRRLHVFVLAVLACALVIVPAAQAARLKTKAVAQDKAAVQKYWTAERMRNAIPADRILSGTFARRGEAAKRAAAATQIPPPYTSQPTSTNGKVFFTDDGLNYVCSGTALLSGNKSTVWTAGHCVHDGASNFHTNWTFVPAYADGSRPYGTWTARTLLTTSGWATSGDFSFDNGAAVVNERRPGADRRGRRPQPVVQLRAQAAVRGARLSGRRRRSTGAAVACATRRSSTTTRRPTRRRWASTAT